MKERNTSVVLCDSIDRSEKTTMGFIAKLSESVHGVPGVGKIRGSEKVQIYNCSKNSLIDAFQRLDDEGFIERAKF